MTNLDRLKFFYSIILCIVYIPVSLALNILTWILSPILALPCFVVYGSARGIIGDPTFTPDNNRAFLVPWLRWFQTHDAPLDEWWYGKYCPDSYLKTHFNQNDYNNKWYVRYKARMNWLCRNPAYGFSFWLLGFNYGGAKFLPPSTVPDDPLWNTGVPNSSFWIVKNSKNQIRFEYETQIYYYKQRCLTLIFGWDMMKNEYPANRRMFKWTINPFKQHSKT